MKEKIKPIYLQLMGILSQMPTFSAAFTIFSTSEIWENYNSVIDKLNTTSGKNYDEFKVIPKTQLYMGTNRPVVNGTLFRQQINGLINHLHGEYFQEDKMPFSGEPQNVFEQNQVVSQSSNLQVVMVTILELQEKLIKKESEFPVDSAEGKFIKILKDSLKNVKSNIELINLILQTAISVGLSLDKLKTIFS